jgi:hypothetical protein
MNSAFTALGIRFDAGLGSPLAMLFNNNSPVKEEFRAQAGLIRVAERAPAS